MKGMSMNMDMTEKDLLEALQRACSIAEYLSNWDKSPQKEWYYEAKKSIAKMKNDS